MEAYFEAKARLFDPERCGTAVTNVDDVHGREIARRAAAAGVPVVTYARADRAADVVATDVGVRPTATEFVLHDRRAGERTEVVLPLPGPHNVWNALAAAATARAVDVPLDVVAAGLAAAPPVPGRFERVGADLPFTVLVDYAHTPDALTQAVASARALAGSGRLAVVFGCGGDRDRDKRGAMGAAAAAADLVLVTSDNPRSEDPAAIAAAAAAGVSAAGAEPVIVLDRRAAIAAALDWAAPGDVVLVAGKGHETGQTAGGVTVAFDDRVVVGALLEDRT
jgi:UDP-N-acetylmuramoyl-L-alanyl-D-glutamate--2,6-diaminopimelate ligase